MNATHPERKEKIKDELTEMFELFSTWLSSSWPWRHTTCCCLGSTTWRI